MGGPNCPLGVGANCPTIDPGTKEKTRHRPPVVLDASKPGRIAKRTQTAPILASFDIENAVVWVNGPLLEAMSNSRRSKKPLPSNDIASLAHEFAHVLQHKDVFEKFRTREKRSAEMIKERADLVAKLTETAYVQHTLAREKQAEKLAQRIAVEMLSHFDRSRGNRGFSPDATAFLAEEKAKQWIDGLRESYSKKARKEHKTLRGKVKKHGSSEGVAKASAKREKTSQKLLPVARIQDVFPKDQSPTLKKLLRRMVKYNIMIVVSLTQEDIKH